MSKQGRDTNRVVAILITNENDDILMGLRNDNGKYANPGGHLKKGECFFDGTMRELKEETGLSGQIIRLMSINRVVDKEVYGDMLVVIYLVAVNDGEPIPGNEEEDARYFNEDELPEYYAGRFGDLIEEIQNYNL